jgi:hypothetical protein
MFDLMTASLFNEKLAWQPARSGGLNRRCGCFCPRGGRSVRSVSCSGQIHQPFEVPTDAFELQFQSVGIASDVAHAPVARATLPPAEDFFNPAAHTAHQR